jgi:hypothetical protein
VQGVEASLIAIERGDVDLSALHAAVLVALLNVILLLLKLSNRILNAEARRKAKKVTTDQRRIRADKAVEMGRICSGWRELDPLSGGAEPALRR